MDKLMHRLLRGLGPAIPRPKPAEALRASLGAGLGLMLTGVLLWLAAPVGPLLDHPLLIAPFAASAVLIFAVPNSPLAQPWAVIVGNGVAALCGLAVLRWLPHPLPAAALAVLLAIFLTAQLRALHPPAGAVAMAVVLSSPPDHPTGWAFAVMPVLAGSVLLVAAGLIWNRLTGRVYPFRQPAAPSPHGTADAAPERRFAPSPAALAAALARLRLGANLGVEDLGRLIASAESETAARQIGQITAAQIMSRDLVTVSPETPLPALAQSFRNHGFKSLPVLRAEDGHYAGLVPQMALVGLSDPDLTARDLATHHAQTAAPHSTIADLIPLLADGQQESLPILDGPLLVGLITRSDLIALLVHSLAHR